MSMRDYIYRKAARWAGNWRRSGSTPTLEMAFVAGWQAALRDQRKHEVQQRQVQVSNVGNSAEVHPAQGAEVSREARDLSLPGVSVLAHDGQAMATLD